MFLFSPDGKKKAAPTPQKTGDTTQPKATYTEERKKKAADVVRELSRFKNSEESATLIAVSLYKGQGSFYVLLGKLIGHNNKIYMSEADVGKFSTATIDGFPAHSESEPMASLHIVLVACAILIGDFEAKYQRELSKLKHFSDLLKLSNLYTNVDVLAPVIQILRGFLKEPVPGYYGEDHAKWLGKFMLQTVESNMANMGKNPLGAPSLPTVAPAANNPTVVVAPAANKKVRPTIAPTDKKPAAKDDSDDEQLTPRSSAVKQLCKKVAKQELEIKEVKEDAADMRKISVHNAGTLENMSQTGKNASATILEQAKEASARNVVIDKLHEEKDELLVSNAAKDKEIEVLKEQLGTKSDAKDEPVDPPPKASARNTPGRSTTARNTPGRSTTARNTPGRSTAKKTAPSAATNASTEEKFTSKPALDTIVWYKDQKCTVKKHHTDGKVGLEDATGKIIRGPMWSNLVKYDPSIHQ